MCHLAKIKSDHCPLLSNFIDGVWHRVRESQFRFQDAWLLDNMFHSLFKDKWDKNVDFGTTLNNLKESIVSWRYNVFACITFRKKLSAIGSRVFNTRTLMELMIFLLILNLICRLN